MIFRKKVSKNFSSDVGGPFLDTVTYAVNEATDSHAHPFSLPLIKNLQQINFPTQVTFFVGENGSGKSTLLEAIADKAGFGPEGGSKNINFKTSEEVTYAAAQKLAECLTLSWRIKPKNGYFFRAESFFNVANYLDLIEREGGGGAYVPYGGKSLHAQSHGESFLAFFKNRLGSAGFFIFDEPEAALSVESQLALMVVMHQVCKNPQSQFIIATHSPILLAYPNATIYSCDGDQLTTIDYKRTNQYNLTKRFLDNPSLYLHHLLED